MMYSTLKASLRLFGSCSNASVPTYSRGSAFLLFRASRKIKFRGVPFWIRALIDCSFSATNWLDRGSGLEVRSAAAQKTCFDSGARLVKHLWEFINEDHFETIIGSDQCSHSNDGCLTSFQWKRPGMMERINKYFWSNAPK